MFKIKVGGGECWGLMDGYREERIGLGVFFFIWFSFSFIWIGFSIGIISVVGFVYILYIRKWF